MADRTVFTYQGKGYRVGDMTVREVESIEAATNTMYAFHVPMSNMGHKLAYMEVFLTRDHPAAEVETIIAGITRDQVDAMWSTEADDLPTVYMDGLPNPVGAPSTVT